VAGHRGFKPSAKSSPVNCGYHRLRAVFDRPQEIEEVDSFATLSRSDLAELFYVRAGDKGLARANQHSAFDIAIASYGRDCIRDALGYTWAEGIDWWIVDRDDGNVAVFRQ
jgi:hypothetical protein